MSGEKSQVGQQILDQSRDVSSRAFGIGIPALMNQQSLLNAANATGGEPGYVKDAFASQRAGLIEAGASADAAARGAADMKMGGSSGGDMLNLDPKTLGTRMADALFSSRTNEALGSLEQSNKTMADILGLTTTAGSQYMGAAGNQLAAAQFLPNYNPAYAAILGVGNLGAEFYGGAKQAGWFNQAPAGGIGQSSFNPATGGPTLA
jgi:hypothetical protein